MKNCFHFNVGVYKGVVAADLFTESVLGHFVIFFKPS